MKIHIKKQYIRKIILGGLLFGVLLFILFHIDLFSTERKWINDELYTPLSEDELLEWAFFRRGNPDFRDFSDMVVYQTTVVPREQTAMDGDYTVRRSFVARDRYLTQVGFLFYNPSPAYMKGEITASIEDRNGVVLGETKLAADKIAHKNTTFFSFTGNTEYLNTTYLLDFDSRANKGSSGIRVNGGEELFVVLEAKGIEGGELGIYLSDDFASDEDNQIPYMVVTGQSVSVFHILLLILALSLSGICVFLSWENHPGFERGLLNALFYATPVFCLIILTVIGESAKKGMFTFLFSLKGLLNLLIIGFFWCLFYAISNRKKIAILLTLSLCYLLGIVNYALLEFRDSPLIASDVRNVVTALQVLPNYTLHINKPLMIGVALGICWLVVAFSLQDHTIQKGKWVRLRQFLIAGILGGLFFFLIFQSNVLRNNEIQVSSYKPKSSYISNGYMLSFWITVANLQVERPAEYHIAELQEITASYASDSVQTEEAVVSETSPNIIVILNESLMDPRVLAEIPTNEDYLPFYRSLQENTVKGTLYSSVFGGRTASSEFELLTGFSVRFLPYFNVPFTSLIKNPVPNLTYTIQESGYEGIIAFHPGALVSYNRNNVYPLLGFEEYVSMDDLEDPDYIRAYVSDASDFQYIIERYESYRQSKEEGRPFYLYNLTIQNHGGYGDRTGDVASGIQITEPFLNYYPLKNYLNLVKASDDALEELVTYFSNVDEPTVIVMTGDHQPNLGTATYQLLERYFDMTIDEETKYEVPFLIWANFDIPEKEDEHISMNYLSSYLLRLTGGSRTGFQKYLLDLYEELPVITDRLIIDKNGNRYTLEDEHPYADLLHTYQCLQYNGFMDEENRIEDFFYLTEE